jgi:rhodanese-related sulfurtransferase
MLSFMTNAGFAAAASGKLSAPEAFAKAKAGEVVLVDIRTPEEWKQTGVAPGAKRVNLNNPKGGDGFVAEMLAALGQDKTRPVALICRTGNRTAMAQRFLEANGFSNVSDVSEGMAGNMSAGPGWLRRGLPVEN